MARFEYYYENILNVKKKLEDQKKIELSSAVSSLEKEKIKLNNLKNKKNKYINNLDNFIGNVVSANELINLYESIQFYSRELMVQNNKVEVEEKKVSNKRQELRNALIERKTYEILKEKAYLDFLEKEKIKENKILDEVISYKYTSIIGG